MLWLKAFHVIFVVTWFAGLFYLPRLFVYHTVTTDPISLERFVVMERRLFAIMTLGATLAAVFGISMILAAPGYLHFGWLHAKLTLVAVLIGYHLWCYSLDGRVSRGTQSALTTLLPDVQRSPRAAADAIVILVIVKPF